MLLDISWNILSFLLFLSYKYRSLGLQGAFCTFCRYSEQECHDINTFSDGFLESMNRSLDEIHQLYEKLSSAPKRGGGKKTIW